MSEAEARGLVSPALRDVVTLLRRRPGWLIGGVLAGLLLGLLAFFLTPPTYISKATLLVESRWFPQEFLQSPLGKSMRDRLQTLQYRLTSDRALAAIAEEVGPERFGHFASPAARESMIRDSVRVEIEDATSPEAAVVSLGYTANDPALARDVVASMSRYAVEERRQEGARQAAATAEVLRSELEDLRGKLTEKSARLALLAAQAPASQSPRSDGFEERRSARLSALNALQTLETEVAQAEATYTVRHPDLLQKRDELRRARGRLSAAPPDSVVPQDPNEEAYRALLREYESDLQTYENLLARRIDATMAERLESTGAMPEIQVLREAQLPKVPIAPNRWMFLGAGAGAGLGLAALLGLLPVLRRQTFFEIDALAEASGLPVVAAIPALPPGSSPDPHLAVLANPDSAAAEQYRHALPYLFRTPGTPVALITSAERGAGKSVCSVNLAASAAGSGRRTLLIDADLRQPSLHALMRVSDGAGLAECVRGELSLAAATVATSAPNLFLLRAGHAADHPVALFDDERLLKLLDAARREFAAIFIDGPPCLPVVDASLLERLATLVFFVVRAEQTPRAGVLRGLRGVGLPVGLILNGVRSEAYRRHFGTDPSEPPYQRPRTP